MDSITARRIAEEVVATIELGQQTPLAVFDNTERIDQGWVFYWNSKEYVATGHEDARLVGQGPLIVLDDGTVLRGGSAERPYNVLCRFGIVHPVTFAVSIEWLEASPLRRSPVRLPSCVQACVGGPSTETTYTSWLKRTTKGETWELRMEVAAGTDERLATGTTVALLADGSKVANGTLGDRITSGWAERHLP